MSVPLVSVHVVTYNQAEFVAETLESILAQDYPSLEVVVADDGSTDGTAEYLKQLEAMHPRRVRSLTGGPNLGITGNSNRCLRYCNGAYVAFLAGDDLMLPGKIRAQVDWLERDRRRVLCAHDVEHFDSRTGRRLKLHSDISPLKNGAGVSEFLSRGYFTATSSLMVRASAIPKRGFDERIRVHSDWKFAAECVVSGGRFGYVPGILGRYRRHDRNSTSTHSDLLWEELHVGFALLEAEFPEHARTWQRCRAYAYYQRAVAALQRGDNKEARRSVATALRYCPALSPKLPLWWLATYVPKQARFSLKVG